MELQEVRSVAARVRENVRRVIVGKDEVIDRLLTALLASGHVLLEDVPGTGKTLLAKALAKSIGGSFKRVQFTPDLLPSDVTGIHFYDQKQMDFVFRPGPVFANVLLADEINRATPRTQSSLLECMEERQVSLDGETKLLSSPFLVLATQNPVEQLGTFPLPEAQLDRFLLKLSIGYPTAEEGAAILKRFNGQQPLDTLEPAVDAASIAEAQRSIADVHVEDDLLAYIVEIAEQSRRHPEVAVGVSPRGTQALLKAAQANAVLRGRSYVTPDDVKELAGPVLAHRLVPKSAARHAASTGFSGQIVAQLLRDIPVPAERVPERPR